MIDEIKNRRSVRKFKPKEIEEEKTKEILEAACYAPSARHLYPYKLTVVKDQEMKQELSEVTPYAEFLADASLGIVVSSEEVDTWIEDCSVVAENIQLEATNQGLGSCWIQVRGHTTEEGKESGETVKEKLGIPKNQRVLCIIAIGYPEEEKEPHKWSEVEEREIYLEKYGNNYF